MEKTLQNIEVNEYQSGHEISKENLRDVIKWLNKNNMSMASFKSFLLHVTKIIYYLHERNSQGKKNNYDLNMILFEQS